MDAETTIMMISENIKYILCSIYASTENYDKNGNSYG